MSDSVPKSIEITCPCCDTRLTVDPRLAVVLTHVSPPKPVHDVDINDATRILADQAQRREDKFRDSWEAEKIKDDVLSRKFDEALRKAKEQPVEKPVRDFDL